MATDREKIISLARECGISYSYATYPCINFNMFEAFYHKAQREAFERAATLMDTRYSECLEPEIEEASKAIRQLIKE